MQDYKVLADELVLEDGSSVAKDAVVSLDPASDYVKNALEQAVIELVPFVEVAGTPCTTFDGQPGTLQGDPLVCVATEVIEKQEETPVVPQKFFQKKLIVAEGERIVGEKTYRTVTLIDGSTYDLTDDEYATGVSVVK